VTLSLSSILAFALANAAFLFLLRLVGRVPSVVARSVAREWLYWGAAVLQTVTASHGVAVLPNDLPWIGLVDDASCALGGGWLVLLALRERTLRVALRRSAASALQGDSRC
jgi:hypothetical protein